MSPPPKCDAVLKACRDGGHDRCCPAWRPQAIDLTSAQANWLAHVEWSQRHGFDGAYAKGSRRKVASALLARGLVSDAGLGVECDGDGYAVQPERWGPLYVLTDEGRRVLAALRRPSPAAPEVKP